MVRASRVADSRRGAGMRGEGATTAASVVAPRRLGGKLPPNPSSTLCRPELQRARQRAAEQAVAEQDAAALERLLGGGIMPSPQQRQETQPLPPASQQQASGDEPPVLDGCLSRLTLQSLLPAAQPSRTQLQQQASLVRQGSSWSAAATAHDTGQPPPAGLAAEPSVLTAYITRLEEDSSMVQRQMAHLQAGTSGRGAFPSPLRSARHAPTPGRREVFVLAKWLEVRRTRVGCQ